MQFPFWKEQRHGTIPMRRMPWGKRCWKERFFCRIFQEPWSCLLSLRIEDSPKHSMLGKIFSNGELLPKDIPRAVRYLTSAAERDHEYAQYLLGKLYLADEGIPKDANAALYWFTRAADQGNAFAQYQLGKLFLYGREVEQDMEKAISYLTASAGQGNVYAAQLLQSVHSNQNWSAALGSLRLLQHLARIIQNRIEDERKGGKGGIDRKLKRKIDEKKQAHGLKQG